MLPREMVILMATAVVGDPANKPLNRPTDAAGEYISHLYDSLVRRGYLDKNGSGGYRLTSDGREAVFEFVHQNKARVKDTIKALQRLGIGTGQDMDKVEEALIEVK